MNTERLSDLYRKIIEYDRDAANIHHLMAVHGYCLMIARLEFLDDEKIEILEAASLLHDIGVKISRQKYGNSNPKHQEEEGPAEAKKILSTCGFSESEIERICFIVGHHHTYSAIDGIDFQILVEADYIVNLMENYCSKESIPAMKENVFKTKSGIFLLESMFGNSKE